MCEWMASYSGNAARIDFNSLPARIARDRHTTSLPGGDALFQGGVERSRQRKDCFQRPLLRRCGTQLVFVGLVTGCQMHICLFCLIDVQVAIHCVVGFRRRRKPSSSPCLSFVTCGGPWFVNDDNPNNRFDHTNLVDQLEASHHSWGAYMESMPSVGYLGDNAPTSPNVQLYVSKHNPFVLFNDIRNNPARLANVKPYDQFAADLASNHVPDFVWISPKSVPRHARRRLCAGRARRQRWHTLPVRQLEG